MRVVINDVQLPQNVQRASSVDLKRIGIDKVSSSE